jgi:hypothetical protein
MYKIFRVKLIVSQSKRSQLSSDLKLHHRADRIPAFNVTYPESVASRPYFHTLV